MKKAAFLALLVGAVVAMAIVGSAVAAAGGNGHTVTQTDNFHGSNPSVATNPCNGDTVDLNQTSNIVQHVTFFPGGDEVWGTFTEEDKVSGLDEGTGVVYTGHSTEWGNFNVNRQNANDTFTASLHLSGSDGSSITYHEVAHEAWNANGELTVQFDKPSLTCG